MIDRDPNHLHPAVRAVLAQHLRVTGAYLRTGCTETFRDETEQAAAWAKGRDALGHVIDPAAVVTNAPPGSSYHGIELPDGTPCALAYHVGIYDEHGGILGYGRALTPPEEALYTYVGMEGERLGMTWGGRWQRRDWLHFEKRVTGLDLAQIRLRLAAGQSFLSA